MYLKLGGWCFRHRRFVAAFWVVGIVALGVVQGVVGSDFGSDPEPPESDSKDAFEILEEHFDFGQVSAGRGGTIVFRADQGVEDPEVRAAMEEIFAIADAHPEVSVLSPYEASPFQSQIAESGPLAGKVAYAVVELSEDITFAESGELGSDLYDAGQEVEGVTVEIGGEALAGFAPPEAETIGLGFAIVILIVSFGSVLAMGLPVGVALAGVSSGILLSNIVSNVVPMPDFATVIATMIGLGVGIDYALFIVTRFRENLHMGDQPEAATRYAMDTAGRAVVFAGITVVASLLGLLLIGLPFVAGLGVAASLTVAATMLASMTLLPALLGFAQLNVEITKWRGLIAAGLVALALVGMGLKIDVLMLALPAALLVLVLGLFIPVLKREVRRREPKPIRETGWHRWSQLIQRRPWRFAIGGTLLLLAISAPVLGIRLGFSDEGNWSEETTTRRAYDLTAEGFGAGFNGPFIVVTELKGEGAFEAFQTVQQAIAADPGVAAASPAFPNNPFNPQAAVIQVYPTTSPQDIETERLVDRLRDEVIPAATAGTESIEPLLTGFVVVSMDFSSYLGGRSLLFFGAVLVVSFLLLMAVFRSLLVPLKAVIMNMLSISAAYGVVVAVFQWGWLSDVVTSVQPAPIEPFIPMMMFAIVFGLSMDYEVFLLSRIREEYSRTGDAFTSVADGLAATARVISAAAAIMVVVFGSFLLEDNRITKVFGTGLGLAVLIDATLVRMLLVPATMELLGKRNWWIPRWLDRVLPSLNVEGAQHTALAGDAPLLDLGSPHDALADDEAPLHDAIAETIHRIEDIEDHDAEPATVTRDDLDGALTAVAQVFTETTPDELDDRGDDWDAIWDLEEDQSQDPVLVEEPSNDGAAPGDDTVEPASAASDGSGEQTGAPAGSGGLADAARQPWTVRLRSPES